MQREVELAALEAVLGVVLEVANRAAVPQDHRAGAVVAGGDHRLEVEVLDRVVLGVDREALLAGSRLGPRGTAKLFSTPPISMRRS